LSFRRQYKPDFFLPDHRIYIEHFAVDEAGSPPPWFTSRDRQRDAAMGSERQKSPTSRRHQQGCPGVSDPGGTGAAPIWSLAPPIHELAEHL
jgi:hypothetical protein